MTTRHTERLGWLAASLLMLVSVSRPLPAQVTFDWATVGDPGNAADTLVMNKGPAADYTTGYGSVGYTYQISKYDVTNSQYTQFLNAVDPGGSNTLRVYNTKMSDANANPAGLAYTGGIDRNLAAASGAKYSVKIGQENAPAIWINWASGARFVNWLANGQGSGSTESGVYDMSVFSVSPFGSATPPTRAIGATVFLPSEDEYYKAAYYDPTKSGTGGYWQYGTQSDTPPSSVAPAGTSNSANIGAGTDGQSGGTLATTMATTGSTFNTSVNYLTNVGAYASAKSYYGLYDLDGLVYNWTEATRTSSLGQQLPIYRGGSWIYNEGASGAAYRNVYSGAGATSYAWYGFRVAGLPSAPPGTTVNVASGTQTQTQAGYALFSGTAPLTKTGAGTLVVDQANTLTGSTSVQQGTLQLANGVALASSRIVPLAGGTVTLAPYLDTTVGGLAPNAGGLVDVGNGKLTVASGLTPTDLVTAIVAGRADGSWTGTSGISSSVAASAVASSIPRSVGWLDNGDGTVTASYAAPGDTNLDWAIDILDAGNFLAGGKFDTGLPATWVEGDFSYDGIVDILDAADFFATGLYDAGNYNGSSGSVAAVPEPAGCGFAAVAGAALLWRRRRCHA